MSRILELREKAKSGKRKIVLPEGEDKRVVKAAAFLVKEKIADVCLLGKPDDIRKLAEKNSIALEGIEILDPATHDKRREIINTFYELRKHKGMTPEEAEKKLEENFVYYGALMTRMNMVRGFVAGASHTTSSVARAAIRCLKIDKEIGTVSSSFLMELEDCPFGEDGLFIFGDCGIIPHPSARQLAGIAVASSDLLQKLFGVKPRVAMLSYSTKGSAAGEAIDRVREAVAMAKEKRPDLMIDGEMQPDTALVPEVAELKGTKSDVAGKANVLIFPSLESGNIAYKLTQRLAKARAVGPILQGLEEPCSDLSRGCSWEDIVDAAAVTVVMGQK